MTITGVKGNHMTGSKNNDVEVLYVTSNYQMDYIPFGLSTVFPNLNKFDVQTTSLAYISKASFKGLNNLKSINFLSGEIEVIPEDTFSDLIYLQTLNLRMNKIQKFEEETFSSLVNLKSLYLHDNKIFMCEFKKYKTDGYNCKASELKINEANLMLTSVTGKHETWATDKDVEVFYILQNYEIQYLPIGLSSFFPKLVKYDIQRSTLKYIANPDFAELINLTTIEIFRTELEVIPEDTFWKLTKLEVLNLRDNKIKSLEEDTFKDLVNLKNLLLQDNQLAYLLVNIFKNNINLLEIDLARNQLRIIDADTFSNLKIIKNLNFEQNVCIKKRYEEQINVTDIKKELLTNCFNPFEPLIDKQRNIKLMFDKIHDAYISSTKRLSALEAGNASNNKTIKQCKDDNDQLEEALKESNISLVNLESKHTEINKNVSVLEFINVQLKSNLTTVLNDKKSAIDNIARDQQELTARNLKLKHDYTDLYDMLIRANQTIARMTDRNDKIKNNLTDAVEKFSKLKTHTRDSFQNSLDLRKILKETQSSLKLFRNLFYISCSILSICFVFFLFIVTKRCKNEHDYTMMDSRIKFVNGMETVDTLK
ncbi:unnamed protein product [Diamesa serratosioi]